MRHELDIYTVYVLKVQNRMNEYTTSNRQRKLTAKKENKRRRISGNKVKYIKRYEQRDKRAGRSHAQKEHDICLVCSYNESVFDSKAKHDKKMIIFRAASKIQISQLKIKGIFSAFSQSIEKHTGFLELYFVDMS